ncbi:MAG: hypothetical protein KDA72_05535 [Planctomycetales bacterium]|nr:hypothetical protein [Planctomycetales bacterium]
MLGKLIGCLRRRSAFQGCYDTFDITCNSHRTDRGRHLRRFIFGFRQDWKLPTLVGQDFPSVNAAR